MLPTTTDYLSWLLSDDASRAADRLLASAPDMPGWWLQRVLPSTPSELHPDHR